MMSSTQSHPKPERSAASFSEARRAKILGAGLIALMFLAALVIRIILARPNQFPSVDGCFYMDQARSLLLNGHLKFSTFPPGWPLLMTLPLFFFDLNDPLAPLRAAQVVNVMMGTAFGWLVWRLLNRETTRRVAVAGAAIALFLPKMILMSTGDMSDMSYACMIALCFLLDRKGPRFTTGLLLGYAYLIRPEALLIAGGLLIVHALRERRPSWRMMAGIAIPLLPYLFFIHEKSGHWNLSSKAYFMDKALQGSHGANYIHMVMDNFGVHFNLLIQFLGIPIVALAVVGAIVRPGRWLIYLAPGLLPPLFGFSMVSRYWIPLVPFLLLGAAQGGTWLVQRQFVSKRRWLGFLLIIVVATGLVVPNIDGYLRIRCVDEMYIGLKDAGLMLRPLANPNTAIASYKPYPSFWAGCRFVKIPADMDGLELVRYCRGQGAEFLIVNAHVARSLRPELRIFLRKPLPEPLRDEVTLMGVVTNAVDPKQNTGVFRINAKP